ncbi:MAG: 50S ribosomal protein L21 [Candidatus Moranbacteria bacterium]|nr:50S ribosomal protein L21 [Candidatus Moranbacteria bacterium]
MLAIIRTGGKQYKVSKGQKVKIEKLDQSVGDTVKFEVLFAGDEKSVHIGEPVLEKAIVEGKVLAQERHDKVKGIKHKAKKRYLVRYGHRQAYTEVEITKISVK